MDFGIIDCHAHIFPPLAGACGFPDVATHRLHQQRAMHMHGNQPYRRRRDHAVVGTRMLWDADDPSEAGRARDVSFRAGRNGRFEWTHAGEDHYVQFLPPHMVDLSIDADTLVAEMDHAGIAGAILQNDHIYGNLAADFAAAGKAHPGRFLGLAQVEEAFAFRDDELARLARQVEEDGMTGLYFTTTGLFRNGYRTLPSDRAFDPLWALVERLDLPVFWVHSANSPIGGYDDEMRHLAAIVERFPALRHVLVHGLPTALYADDDERIALPGVIEALLGEGQVWAEILYPIAWGGRLPYPYARAHGHIRQLYERFGGGRFMWGSDMPNVARSSTYRQTLTYMTDHCGFVSDADMRRILRDNALDVFAPQRLARAGLA